MISVDEIYEGALQDAELARQKSIVLARKYHEGEQGAKLTPRLESFLTDLTNNQIPFRMNTVRSIVTAVSERLIVLNLDSPDPAVGKWLQDAWRATGLDALQDDVHEITLRDGECFVILDWDSTENLAIPIIQERYTSLDAGGNGEGCIMIYPQNDYNQKPLYCIKAWSEKPEGEEVYRQRETIYYPDRIERYIRDDDGEWIGYVDPNDDENTEYFDGDPSIIDWTDEQGEPAGIPIIHFVNKQARCEAWDGIPLQNAINKSAIDLMTAVDMTAFRIYVALGFIPTTDGKDPAADMSNWLPIEPGRIVGTTKAKGAADFYAIEPADVKGVVDVTEQFILWMAMVTDTPVNRFISTRQIASDKTLKEQETPLLAKVRNRQLRFGHKWEKVLRMMMKMYDRFAVPKDVTLALDAQVTPIWAQSRISGEGDHLDNLIKKKSLGISRRQLWAEAGYSEQQITQVLKETQTEGQDGQATTTTKGSGEPGSGGSESGEITQ